MRISTSQMQMTAINAILDQQSALSKTQLQVATGKRVVTPSDDPVASAQTLNLNQALSVTQQYQSNADAAKARLSLEEGTLSGVTSQIQRLQQLAVQAGNSTNTNQDLQAISVEVKQVLQGLLGQANTKDNNNVYLFAGYKGQTQPFAPNGSGSFDYLGDDGQRQLQVGPSRTIADADPGNSVFMNIRNGNGTFTTKDNTANTGTGIIDPGSVVDPTAYVPDAYTITFVTNGSGQLAYNVFGANGGQIVPPLPQNATTNAPAYQEGGAISFNGIQTNVKGTPVAGDSFTLSPSANQSLFDTVQNFANALDAGASDNTSRTKLANAINRTLTDLGQSLQNIVGVRADVGARLNAIDSETNNNGNTILQVQQTLSTINDLDYASAVSKLNLQLTGLQAAQQAFTRVQGLSLFNYLR